MFHENEDNDMPSSISILMIKLSNMSSCRFLSDVSYMIFQNETMTNFAILDLYALTGSHSLPAGNFCSQKL